MSKILKNEIFIIGFFIIIFIAIRSINFASFYNFTQDPASFSISALEIFQNKKIELIGPPISFRLGERYLFQGSITYYFILFFLFLGNFDPLNSGYLFMIFCSLMTIPLYYGFKKLINSKVAILSCILYSLLPVYIEHTRFFWNPNFQLALTPILIFLVSKYNANKKTLTLFFISFFSSLLLLFHYQFVLIIFGIFIYIFLFKKEKPTKILIFLLGFIFGFSPIILFEIRHNFYNLQTIFIYLQNFDKVFLNKNSTPFATHYFLSISAFILLIIGSFIKDKVKNIHLFLIFIFLFIYSLNIFLPSPEHPYAMEKKWFYKDEIKVNKIILSQKITNFNITYPFFDNVAISQKYFLKKEKIKINYEDYYHNEYLFVVNNNLDFIKYSAYELKIFAPNKLINQWKINDNYKLYLFKKI